MQVTLKRQELTVAASRALCFELVAAAGRTLEERAPDSRVVQFDAVYRGRPVTTVELVTVEPPKLIHYRWLEGPLPEVHETISFDEDGPGTVLRYEGSFSAGTGLVAWLKGRVVVKPAFDRIVLEHLQQAKELAEKRAARSLVYGDSHAPPQEG